LYLTCSQILILIVESTFVDVRSHISFLKLPKRLLTSSLHHPISLLITLNPLLLLIDSTLGTSSWVVWIYEELLLDQFHLVWVMPINLFHLLHLGNKRNGRGFSYTKGGKSTEDLENSLMAIVQIDLAQQ
jgi:hypothetical protein